MMEGREVENEVPLLGEVTDKLPNTLVFCVFHHMPYAMKNSIAEN